MNPFARVHRSMMGRQLFSQCRRALALTLVVGTIATMRAGQDYSEPYTFTTLAGATDRGSADGTGAAARFRLPQGVAVDGSGTVYVADTSNHVIRKITPAGVVTTWAGKAGIPGSADGQGAAARFYRPVSLAVDKSGNVYVADGHCTLRKITPAGVVSTLAGSFDVSRVVDGKGSAAGFAKIRAVTVDARGIIYATDGGGHVVRKITAAGVVTTIAGQANMSGAQDGSGNGARFNNPAGIAVDAQYNVYVADSGNSTIRKITPAGTVTTLAGKAGVWETVDGKGDAAHFRTLQGLALDAAGNLYAAEVDAIRKITSAGVVTTLAGKPTVSGTTNSTGGAARFNGCDGLALDKNGTLLVADAFNHSIRKVTAAGAVTLFAGSGGHAPVTKDGQGAAAQFVLPGALAADAGGVCYVIDNQVIRKISATGKVSTLAGKSGAKGSADGSGSAARFSAPAALALDAAGNIYVADTENHTIRKVTSAGKVTTVAGAAGQPGYADGNAAAARFHSPSGIAVDKAGNLYVADTVNYVIRKITPAGVVTTLAGQAGVMGADDGKGAAARFYGPAALGIDGSGNLYVSEGYSGIIRKVTPAGVVSALAGQRWNYGTSDGSLADARFTMPSGIAVDANGNLYVADMATCLIRMITTAGKVKTIAGAPSHEGEANGSGGQARFSSPTGVALDAAGRLYVTDTGNYSVRRGQAQTNAAPVVGAIANQSLTEDGAAVLIPFTVTDETPTWNLKFSAVSSNRALLSDLAVENNLFGDNPSLRMKPAANASGMATITVTASDGALSGSVSFTVTVKAVNDAPTISAIADLKIVENGRTAALAFTVGDVDTAVEKLTVTTASSNQKLVPAAGIVLGGSGAKRTVTIVPAANQRGTATITLTVSDGALTARETFVVTVVPNTPPTLTVVADQIVKLNQSTAALALTVGDAESSPGTLVLSAKSSNPALVPVANIVFGGSGAKRTLKITPVKDKTGAATITVTVSDGALTANMHFVLTVVSPPVVTMTSAARQLIAPGGKLTLTTTVSGGGTIAYQWFHNGKAIAGATAKTYSRSSFILSDAGAYWLRATNDAGTVLSAPCFVLFAPATTTIVGWGDSSYRATVAPTGIGRVVAIAAAVNHSLALKADGTVATWGEKYTTNDAILKTLKDVVAIAAGRRHSLALKSDGTVVTWGYADDGLGTVPKGLARVVAIAAGDDCSLALKMDGTIVAWGTGSAPMQSVPSRLKGVVAIAAGAGHALALKSDGTVVAWGSSSEGQVTVPSTLTNAVGIGAGVWSSFAWRSSGYPFVWGSTSTDSAVQTQAIESIADVTAVVGGRAHVLVLSPDGTLKTWGSDTNGVAKLPKTIPAAFAVAAGDYHSLALCGAAPGDRRPVVTTSTAARQVITAGQTVSLKVAATGPGTLAYQWYHDGRKISGATTAAYSRAKAAPSDAGAYWVEVTNADGLTRSAPFFVVFARGATEVRSWSGNPSIETSPAAGLSDVVSVGAGKGYSLGLKSDGTVVTWTTGAVTTVANIKNAVAIAAGASHALALNADGTITMWGDNTYQQKNIPPGLKNVVAIAAGEMHSLAVKSDGTVVGWGFASSNYAPPVGLSGVVAVAAGSNYSLALKSDGTVVTWGALSNPPSKLSGIVAISAGDNYAAALKSDGTVPWGYTGDGKLSGIVAIASSSYHSVALKSNGTVVRWGDAYYVDLSVPADLAGVIAVAVGQRQLVTLRDATQDKIPTITTQPASQTVTEGNGVTFSVVAAAAGARLRYQWYHGATAVVGATGASLTVSAVAPSDASDYTVIVTDWRGSITSEVAALTVRPLPRISLDVPARQLFVAGQSLSFAVTAVVTGDATYQWYRNGRPIAGATSASCVLEAALAGDAGYYYVDVTDTVGRRRSAPFFTLFSPPSTILKTWPGDRAYSNYAGLVAVSAGLNHVLAVKAGGTVVAWDRGGAYPGALGSPSTAKDVVAVAAGEWHSLALRADGTVVAWGNGAGVPAGLKDVVSIAASGNLSVALKADGTAVSWMTGENVAYPLFGSAVDARDLVAIAAGDIHQLGLRADGTVLATGGNGYGQATVPSGLDTVIGIAAGPRHSLALKTDGTVVGWGRNDYGAVTIPDGLGSVVGLAATADGSIALKADGTLAVWGGFTQAPVDVNRGFVIAANTIYGLALCDATPLVAPVITTQPQDQTVAEGGSASFSAVASGYPAPSYRWQISADGGTTWNDLTEDGTYNGVATNTLTIATVISAMNGDQFRCLASNSSQSDVASSAATLTVETP